MNNGDATEQLLDSSTTNLRSRFKALCEDLSGLDKKVGDIHHDERCGNETGYVGEGMIEWTEFVCYCEFDQRRAEADRNVQALLEHLSDFAATHGINTQRALKIHQRSGSSDRAYTAARSMGLVRLPLELLGQLKRFEEGTELAIQYKRHNFAVSFLEKLGDFPRLLNYAQEQNLEEVVVKTFLQMDDAEGALKYAESHEMHKKSLEILRSKKRTDEAVNYAERYHLHDEALGMLATPGRFEALLDYGARHDRQSAVRIKSKKILEELLDEGHNSEVAFQARELCTAMENHQLQRSAALYREVIEEFERRVKARERICSYEETLKSRVGYSLWLDIADLELSLGNYVRYRKIWEKTKELRKEVRFDPSLDAELRQKYESEKEQMVALAQSMIDDPRYHTPQEKLPRWGASTRQLLYIALLLAELLEAENEKGEKKYPFISLESVITAWGKEGTKTFFNNPYRNYPGSYSLSNAAQHSLQMLASSLKSVKSSEAFTFLISHYPYLFNTNNPEGERSNIELNNEIFNHIGELLEYVLAETAPEGEASSRKKIALEHLLYVPVGQLTQENIFEVTTGGPDAVWKHIVGNNVSLPVEAGSFLHDPRLREIQQAYSSFDKDTKKRMKQVFFDAYTSPEKTASLDQALTFYMELKQAYGKPMVFPADHPLYFLHALPQDEAERQLYAEQVMDEICSSWAGRKQTAEAALGRQLHAFFEDAIRFGTTQRRFERYQKEGIAKQLAEFLAASSQQLNLYREAMRRTSGTLDLFFALDAAAAGEHKSLPPWTFLEHYDHFSSGILTEHSSLLVLGVLSHYVISTKRMQGEKSGIKERMLREFDAIAYVFREMYKVARVQAFRENTDFRQAAVNSIVKLWKEKQEKFLPTEVAETLAHFNYNRFFDGKDEEIQRYLNEAGKQASIDSMFVNQQNLIFSRILDLGYYLQMPQGLGDDFINAINRLKKGLSASWDFDEIRFEYNEDKLNDFFNNAAECTGNGGKYQRYGYAHMQDRNIGIIAANLYEAGKYTSTVGKAFLARCSRMGDASESEPPGDDVELLYVDGVVMLQDIADSLNEPHREARWLPLYTKAILTTAVKHGFEEVLINASHQLAQRSVWQYIRHMADLIGLRAGRDFTYREGPVDDGSKERRINIKTMSKNGFELVTALAAQSFHDVTIIPDGVYEGKHLLEGFWINHWKRSLGTEEAPSIPPFFDSVVKDHSPTPQINDGRGFVIGFRRRTEKLVELFNQKYGAEYGTISTDSQSILQLQ